MIINLRKFISEERPFWTELESFLDKLETEPEYRLDLRHVERFHYLYQRASSDLSKLMTFSAEPNSRVFLESLVGRAYGVIHETREKPHRLAPLRWFFQTFPRTFRRHIKAFWISVAAMMVGILLGGFLIATHPGSKQILMPFGHLLGDPSERVAKEERSENDRMANARTAFSSQLMTHNTRVSILTLALGITFGVGTAMMLFYNGVILGAVAVDYILAGESTFLLGWLLPHGSIEIPAILLAGQAGLILAGALIGWQQSLSLKMRLRLIAADLVTLICGIALMLVWAGIIESFFSQYHEPVLPYEVKIGFGLVELVLLALFLSRSGSRGGETTGSKPGAHRGRK
jgi:uncharacterized membrane protein SpoIIM required for sporulation